MKYLRVGDTFYNLEKISEISIYHVKQTKSKMETYLVRANVNGVYKVIKRCSTRLEAENTIEKILNYITKIESMYYLKNSRFIKMMTNQKNSCPDQAHD